jgi:hypothetical protein
MSSSSLRAVHAWCVDTFTDVSVGQNDFGVRIRHGRQRTKMLRPPTILESEQLRLRDKTINGMLRPSTLLGDGSPGATSRLVRQSVTCCLHDSDDFRAQIRKHRRDLTCDFRELQHVGDAIQLRLRRQYTSSFGLFRRRAGKIAHIQRKP